MLNNYTWGPVFTFFPSICWLINVLGLRKIFLSLVFPQTTCYHLFPSFSAVPPCCSRLERRTGGTKGTDRTIYWKLQWDKKMSRSSNHVNNKILQKGECGAWPDRSHVSSGSGPALPLLWPEGSDLRWNGIMSRSIPADHAPHPSYCKN